MLSFPEKLIRAPFYIRYSLAVVLFSLALLLRFLMAPVEGGLAFVTFYPIILITFYYCGSGPGILVSVLSGLAGEYFFIPPYRAFSTDIATYTPLAFFCVTAVLISLVIIRLHKGTQQLEISLEALRESEERFRQAMEASTDGLWDWNITDDTGFFSPAYYRMLGYEVNEFPMTGHSWSELIHPDDYQQALTVNQECIDNRRQSFEVEYRMKCKDGSWKWILGRGKALQRDAQGHAIRMIGTHVDITERKRNEEQVRQLAFYDLLTRLPNRRLLNDHLNQAMAASKRSGRYGAVMFIDLDNFKPLNDTHGHDVGDLLLIEAADRLMGCVRETDTVARFGGDEFVVVLIELDVDKAKSTTEARHVSEKIRAAMAAPYLLAIRSNKNAATIIEHRCTASIGVALFINHEASPDDTLRNADNAMYQVKEAGRNSIRFYDVKT
ncbi:diguanylate cyclase domain-containing protein [Georgfuchsia toluolica]|nr:diguanylate cyclase [Georgfuchsia toluolica]